MCINNFLQNLFQLFLTYVEVNFQKQLVALNFTVNKSEILRNNLIKDKSSQCRLYRSCLNSSVRHSLRYTHLDT